MPPERANDRQIIENLVDIPEEPATPDKKIRISRPETFVSKQALKVPESPGRPVKKKKRRISMMV